MLEIDCLILLLRLRWLRRAVFGCVLAWTSRRARPFACSAQTSRSCSTLSVIATRRSISEYIFALRRAAASMCSRGEAASPLALRTWRGVDADAMWAGGRDWESRSQS
jgi:hypothetical protein